MNDYIIRIVLCLVIAVFFLQCSDKDDVTITQADDQALAVFFAENELTPVKTASGLYYVPIATSDSTSGVESGMVLSVFYKVTDLSGTVLEDKSDTSNTPLLLRQGVNAVIPIGLDEGLGLMRQGETYRFFIPSRLAYALYPITAFPKETIYDVEVYLEEIRSEDDIEVVELENIENYIEENNLNDVLLNPVDSVRSIDVNLFYKTTEKGIENDLITAGDTVNLDFELIDLDDVRLSAIDGFSHVFGEETVFSGFGRSLGQMEYGASVKVLMTSSEAYKESVFVVPRFRAGDLALEKVIPAYAADILPYTSLIMNVKMNNRK